MVSTSSTQRLADHLGSTSLTTDSAGNVISELRYTAWGEVRYQAGTTSTSYTYTGQYSNTADFGLMFYNARWYDPALGRFTSADSIVPAGVQGYDRYAYVNNNPLRYTDPSGHMAWEGDGGAPVTTTGGENPNKDPDQNPEGLPSSTGSTGGADACSGSNPSIVCVDPTLLRTGSTTSDVVYPTNQPPAGWDGMNAEVTPLLWVSVIELVVDWTGRFTYSSGPSRVSGQYVYATVDYEVHSSNVVEQYTEISGVQIVNNTDTVMDVNNILTSDYVISPGNQVISVDAGGAINISFSYDSPITGNPVTVNLSNGSYSAQIVVDVDIFK